MSSTTPVASTSQLSIQNVAASSTSESLKIPEEKLNDIFERFVKDIQSLEDTSLKKDLEKTFSRAINGLIKHRNFPEFVEHFQKLEDTALKSLKKDLREAFIQAIDGLINGPDLSKEKDLRKVLEDFKSLIESKSLAALFDELVSSIISLPNPSLKNQLREKLLEITDGRPIDILDPFSEVLKIPMSENLKIAFKAYETALILQVKKAPFHIHEHVEDFKNDLKKIRRIPVENIRDDDPFTVLFESPAIKSLSDDKLINLHGKIQDGDFDGVSDLTKDVSFQKLVRDEKTRHVLIEMARVEYLKRSLALSEMENFFNQSGFAKIIELPLGDTSIEFKILNNVIRSQNEGLIQFNIECHGNPDTKTIDSDLKFSSFVIIQTKEPFSIQFLREIKFKDLKEKLNTQKVLNVEDKIFLSSKVGKDYDRLCLPTHLKVSSIEKFKVASYKDETVLINLAKLNGQSYKRMEIAEDKSSGKVKKVYLSELDAPKRTVHKSSHFTTWSLKSKNLFIEDTHQLFEEIKKIENMKKEELVNTFRFSFY